MSDFDSDESEPQQQASPTPAVAASEKEGYWEAEAKKAFQARDAARTELRNQIQQGYDPQVVELVPQSLPPQEWKEYADKLVAFKGQAPPNPTETSEPVQQVEPEAPSPTEQKLASVSKGPSSTSASPPSGFTQDELLQIAEHDPERYSKLAESGTRLQKLGDEPKLFGHDR